MERPVRRLLPSAAGLHHGVPIHRTRQLSRFQGTSRGAPSLPFGAITDDGEVGLVLLQERSGCPEREINSFDGAEAADEDQFKLVAAMRAPSSAFG